MPQLPSGRHVGIQANPLDHLIRRVLDGWSVHDLMAICNVDDLLAHLDVVEFLPQPGAAPPYLNRDSDVPPAGLAPRATGLTVSMALQENGSWPGEDRAAMRAFLEKPGTHQYLQCLLDEVKKVKQQVRDHGTWAARVQAAWWDAGVHPLQPKDEE